MLRLPIDRLPEHRERHPGGGLPNGVQHDAQGVVTGTYRDPARAVMGINLFVSSTVFDRPILSVIRAVVPFLLLMLFCLVVSVWVPGLSLWLVEN